MEHEELEMLYSLSDTDLYGKNRKIEQSLEVYTRMIVVFFYQEVSFLNQYSKIRWGVLDKHHLMASGERFAKSER